MLFLYLLIHFHFVLLEQSYDIYTHFGSILKRLHLPSTAPRAIAHVTFSRAFLSKIY